jgi:uncharacterized protein with von Willebrand factor type A (vWA) domain
MSEYSVIAHDDYDARAYQETLTMYPKLRQLIEQERERLPTAAPLIEDLFYTLYRPAPTLREPEQLTLAATVNRSILEEVMSTSQWDSIRQAGTVGDQLYAAVATATVAKAILKRLDRKMQQRLRELHEAEAEAERLFTQAETLEDLAEQKPDRAQSLYDQARQAREAAAQQQQQAEQLAAALQQDAERLEDETRGAARPALEEAEGELEAMSAAVKTFTNGYADGGMGGGSSSMSLKEKLQLANRVGQSERLRQIAQLCGRMTRIALQTQKTRIIHPPDEIVGITIGNDIGKMLPAETALLAEPMLEAFFFKKYADKSLMQLDMRGSEKQGRGPVIVALDSSGSMSGALGGQASKEAWSKAVMLALLAIARKQKRDFAVLHFSDVGEMKAFVFPKGEARSTDLIATTEFFYGGGTAYDTWMQAALKLVEESRFNRADVICVSDGDVHISARLEQDWNRRRREREMRCYSVLLGDQRGAAALGRISDALATVDDLRKDTSALEMMFSI